MMPRQYSPEYRERENLRRRLRRRDHPEIHREKSLIRRYGLTQADYQALLDSQGGVCAICHNPPKKNRLCVDHDHETGAIRGLLCVRCNTRYEEFLDESWKQLAREYRDKATQQRGNT